jgi:hypothetical protein
VNPLADRLPDVLFGRLPVKSSAELTHVVNKIIGYESAPLDPGGSSAWRSRIAYLADNYRLTQAEGGGFDGSGNFEQFSETSISQLPGDASAQRMYYDPTAPAWDGVHEPDATQAYNRSKAIFNAGAGVINYAGHANVAQIAVTTLSGYPNFLLNVLDPPAMSNSGRLPIVLQMTCLTSAFHDLAYFPEAGLRGETLDERLILAMNGAVAVWGSSGLGVAFGHEALQRGFYKGLWSQPRLSGKVGAATQSGYVELFAQTSGANSVDDSLRTFLLLGDPLTTARIAPPMLYLPNISR